MGFQAEKRKAPFCGLLTKSLMLISHSKKFIFIHIYKTAGTSVSKVFLPNSRLVDRLAYDFYPTVKLYALIAKLMQWENEGMRHFTGFHKHANASTVKLKMKKSQFDSYYKFAFVRNPYDHTVSLYHYILQTKCHFFYEKVRDMDFAEFVEFYVSTKPRRQVDFVYDPVDGACLIDYVGKLENLNSDLNFLIKQLGLNPQRSLKHDNPSVHREKSDWRSYYDSASRIALYEYFCDDFKRFNYEV